MGLALRDLVLVVREDQVATAGVDVDLIAERLAHHRRALDVPARATLAPGALPERLAGLGSFPEGKVARVALARLELQALSRGDELAFGRPPRELAILGKAADFEVDVTVNLV